MNRSQLDAICLSVCARLSCISQMPTREPARPSRGQAVPPREPRTLLERSAHRIKPHRIRNAFKFSFRTSHSSLYFYSTLIYKSHQNIIILIRDASAKAKPGTPAAVPAIPGTKMLRANAAFFERWLCSGNWATEKVLSEQSNRFSKVTVCEF